MINDYRNQMRKDYIKLSVEEMLILHNDLNPSNEEKILKGMLPLAYQLANKYWYHSDIEDLIAIANLGILQGIRTYDSNKSKASIVTYCNICARNAISIYLKQFDLIRKPGSYSGMTEEKKEAMAKSVITDDITLYEKYMKEDCSNYKVLEEDELYNILIKLGKPIKDKHIKIYSLYYLGGLTYEEISNVYGISKQRIGQIINLITEKINNNPIIKDALADLLF